MKALILAAGFGTRLKPYSDVTPKCLFPIDGRPLLDRIVADLVAAGCSGIVVNTHHLALKIEAHIRARHYPIPVAIRHEPEILGTGGAIKNAADFWGEEPFMVVNADILTDIPFAAAYDFHLQHPYPATLALCDDPEFNTVAVDREHFVLGFGDAPAVLPAESRRLTFTGIQVLDPALLALIPAAGFAGSIDMYRRLLSSGGRIKAYLPQNCSWNDIGTPERYRQAALVRSAPQAFQRAFGAPPDAPIDYTRLAGDGSDRSWYRVTAGPRTLILADHGLRRTESRSEVDAFAAIGRHLQTRGLPVPQIFLCDPFSGLVFLEDLGDCSLQDFVRRRPDKTGAAAAYRTMIGILVRLSTEGSIGFKRGWTCQTTDYDRDLILEKECRYFVEAFLNGYLGRSVRFEALARDFSALADGALRHAVPGLMHRDLQSRNIMVKNDRFFLIDFQGARIGPIQYDLASLLIDPYVELPPVMQDELLELCCERLAAGRRLARDAFYKGYRYCSLTRNLQMLGAFGYLSRQKGKTAFEAYIPAAVRTLKDRIGAVEGEFPQLQEVVARL